MRKLLKSIFPNKQIAAHKVNGPAFKPGDFDESLLLESKGLAHLDFIRVMEHAETIRDAEDQSSYLTNTVLEWLYRLSQQVGDDFQILRTKHFAVLAPKLDAKVIAEFCESTRESMVSMFSKLPRNELGYPIAIIAFPSEQDFYYSYLYFFSSDDIKEEAASAGMFYNSPLNHHIVFQLYSQGNQQYQSILAHELSHSFLAGLYLPPWVDEGITQNIEESVVGFPYGRVSNIREIAERNREVWNTENIQFLWDGSAFKITETQEYAYFFSQVLVNLIKDEICLSNDEFVQFVSTADWKDAGARAFEEIFGQPLGVLVEEVLGGKADDWQPKALK